MNAMIFFIVIVIASIFWITVILILRYRFLKRLRDKDRGIIRQMHENERLHKNMEYISAEKRVLGELLEQKTRIKSFRIIEVEKDE